ncbi:WD40-repeat-containing domain protein [Gorgonomyces haynaldii]|nr:WD40-repeat-containing domain protein [Gorgonomyces haynaldii]
MAFNLRLQTQNPEQNYPTDIALEHGILAVSTLLGNIQLHDVQTLQQVVQLPRPESVITSMKIDEQEALIWSAYKDGVVLVWDHRQQAPVMTFQHQQPISSFDYNCSRTLLACGTDLVKEDAFIHFWDIRQQQIVASFDECHSDDVTCLKFHPTTPEAMISGSTDGLTCLYDLKIFDQDEALYQVIKDDSVAKIGYFGPNSEYIYYITHMQTFSIWKFYEGEKIDKYGDARGVFGDVAVDYLLDCTYDEQGGRLFLVGGSQNGSMGILDVNLGNLKLAFTLHGGHTDIVRAYTWKQGIFASCGEDGRISIFCQ